MIQFPFYIEIPDSEPWRLVLCPNEQPTAKDILLVALQREEAPLFSPVGAVVEQHTNGMLKVSLTAKNMQQMRCGSWSAVMQVYKGDKWVNSSVSLDVVTITDRTNETDLSGLIEAFASTLEPIGLPTLNK